MPNRKDPALVKSETLTIKITAVLKARLLDAATRCALDVSTLSRMLIAQGLEACECANKKRKKIK